MIKFTLILAAFLLKKSGNSIVCGYVRHFSRANTIHTLQRCTPNCINNL